MVPDQPKRELFYIFLTDEERIDSKCSNNPVMSDRPSTLHRTKHRILRRTDSFGIIIGSMVIMIRAPKGFLIFSTLLSKSDFFGI